MHELSLCGAIADTVLEHAAGRPVRTIRLQIGHFRQVVPETLEFCWSMRTSGSPLEGSDLVIDSVPAVIACRDCGEETELADPFLRCGACDGTDIELLSGEEFLIESIDISQEVH